jgi:hypothetical protein
MSPAVLNEVLHAHEWLHGKLKGDATLMALATDVYPDLPLSGAVSPWIVYYVSDPGGDVMVNGQNRILADFVYTVRVDVKGKSYGPARPILDRIDVLLHRASGMTAAVHVESCTRIAPIPPYTTVEMGEATRHAGAEYRVQVSAL